MYIHVLSPFPPPAYPTLPLDDCLTGKVPESSYHGRNSKELYFFISRLLANREGRERLRICWWFAYLSLSVFFSIALFSM